MMINNITLFKLKHFLFVSKEEGGGFIAYQPYPPPPSINLTNILIILISLDISFAYMDGVFSYSFSSLIQVLFYVRPSAVIFTMTNFCGEVHN